MLGHDIGEEYVTRTAGSRRDAGLLPVLRRWGDVGATDASVVTGKKCADQIVEPIGVSHAVAVRVGNYLTGCCSRTDIACDAQAVVGLRDGVDPRVMRKDLLRVVGGTVINNDHLVVRVVDLLERAQAGLQGLAAVVAADDHRDLGDAGQGSVMGDRCLVVVEATNGREGLLGSAVTFHQAEGPVHDIHPSTVPLVGPGVENRAGEAPSYDGIEMPADHLGLLLFRVANRVHAELTHDERLVLGEVLETSQVAFKILPAVQVDIEGQEIDILRQKILGRGVARVGVEGAGILAACDVDQVLDELRHALGSKPADHRGGDLVAEQVAEDRVMPFVLPYCIDHGLLDRGPYLGIIEELDMLHPGDAEEHTDAVLQAEIKEPTGRCRVDADEVGT